MVNEKTVMSRRLDSHLSVSESYWLRYMWRAGPNTDPRSVILFAQTNRKNFRLTEKISQHSDGVGNFSA